MHAGARVAVPEVMATFALENASAALAISVEAILRVADMPRTGDHELAQVAREASTTAHQIIEGVVNLPDDWSAPPAPGRCRRDPDGTLWTMEPEEPDAATLSIVSPPTRQRLWDAVNTTDDLAVTGFGRTTWTRCIK